MPIRHSGPVNLTAAPETITTTAPVLRHRPAEAGASARERAQRLRASEIATQHRRGLPLLCGALLLDITVLVPVFDDSTGLMHVAALAVILGLPAGIAKACYPVGAEVQKWRAGARGERCTARLVRPLTRQGWFWFHDRAIPRSRANLDHFGVLPDGRGLVLLDSKKLRRGARVTVRGGVLYCGRRAYPQMLENVRWEARSATDMLHKPVAPVVVVHGAKVPGGRIRCDGLTIVAASRLRRELAAIPHRRDVETARLLALRADRALPRYTG